MTSLQNADVDGEIWRSFKQLLDNPAQITLPPETLYGAISHFLVTRPLDTLPEVITTLTSSKSLWSVGSQGRGVRDAVRVAVSTKQQTVRQALTKAYFPAYRERKQLQQWLTAMGRPLVQAGDTLGRAQILLGLLEGLSDVRGMERGDTRHAMEDELVVAVAGYGGIASLSATQLDLLCSTITIVDEARLQVLDLEEMASHLEQNLIKRIKLQLSDGVKHTENCARALGRLLQVLDRGEAQDRVSAWTLMQTMCAGIQQLAEQNLVLDASPALLIFRSVVQSLVISEPPSLASTSRATVHPAMQIAGTIVTALCDLVQATSGEVQAAEDFQPVLYGCLDVVEAKGGESGADDLIRHLCGRPSLLSPDRASFVLSVGEQLINGITASVLRDALLPLTQRYMREPEHSASFEATHAFCLAMIKAFVGSSARDHAQDDFMREFIPAYARSLLKLAAESSITSDQLRAAYTIACDGAAHLDFETLSSCIGFLLDSIHRADTSAPIAQALRLTRISVAPTVPIDELNDYLERLAWNILDAPAQSAHRTELVDAGFEMVAKHLPDGGKRTGMEWWLRWVRALSGRSEPEPVQAKL